MALVNSSPRPWLPPPPFMPDEFEPLVRWMTEMTRAVEDALAELHKDITTGTIKFREGHKEPTLNDLETGQFVLWMDKIYTKHEGLLRTWSLQPSNSKSLRCRVTVNS